MIFLILDKITIKNYRQYRDVEIEFAKDTSKNFTIIKGNNGTGKTTLLNALSWCLHGSEIHDYGDDSLMEICNNKAVNSLEDGENIDVFVKMDFIDDGKVLSFSRCKKFNKNNGELKNLWSDEVCVEIESDDGWDVTPDQFHYYVEKKIPKEIEDYFFFDGARLNAYFQKNSTENIKGAVFGLSQLNLIDAISKNLPKVKKNYINKQKKHSPEIGGINENIKKYEDLLNEFKSELEKSKKIRIQSEKDILEYEQKLIDIGAESIKEDVKRDQQLRVDLDKLEKNLKDKQHERSMKILKNYPFIISYNTLKNFLDKGNIARRNKQIPPDINRSFINDLLENGKCICGVDLSEDDEHRQNVLKLLEETSLVTDKSSEIGQELSKISNNVLIEIGRFKKDISEINKDIYNFSNDKEEKLRERRAIEARLKSSRENSEEDPEQRVEKLDNLKRLCEEEVKKQSENIGKYESKIEHCKNELNTLHKKKAAAIKARKKYDDYEKKIDFCQKASVAAEEIKNILTEDMRIKIQNLTKEKFIKIQWKQNEFNDLCIDENYDLFIKNRSGGTERPGDLSDGEKLCLGLCFMSALHNISGFDLPVIMDTPLGIVDVDMRQNLAKFLPQFVGGKQIILLVTGSEYTDDFKNVLFDHIGKEYVIQWDSSEIGKESKVMLNG